MNASKERRITKISNKDQNVQTSFINQDSRLFNKSSEAFMHIDNLSRCNYDSTILD